MAREMACRKCKRVTTEKVCPGCKSSDLTPDWNGCTSSRPNKFRNFKNIGNYSKRQVCNQSNIKNF